MDHPEVEKDLPGKRSGLSFSWTVVRFGRLSLLRIGTTLTWAVAGIFVILPPPFGSRFLIKVASRGSFGWFGWTTTLLVCPLTMIFSTCWVGITTFGGAGAARTDPGGSWISGAAWIVGHTIVGAAIIGTSVAFVKFYYCFESSLFWKIKCFNIKSCLPNLVWPEL